MREKEQEYSTFEVTLPRGANEHTLALFGLGNALGWNITERAALSSDMERSDVPDYLQVTPGDLEDISNELWDTAVYGQTAANFLEEGKRNFRKDSYLQTHPTKEGGEIVATSDLVRFRQDSRYELGRYPSHPRSLSARGRVEEERLEAMVRALWSTTPFAFESPSISKGVPRWAVDDDTIAWWDLEPGSVSRIRLAHHARITGTARHSVRGTIGKAHDVINVAAGLATKEEVAAKPAEPDQEFIDYSEFRAQLRSSDLGRYTQSVIRQTIEWSLLCQIRYGGEDHFQHPEVLVEGLGEWVTRGGNRVPHFEKIARFSLAHLLDNDPPARSITAKKFLAQFA